MKVPINGQEMYMDEFLKTNWDRAKELMREDWDMVILYDGYEGSGKSVKAMQDAAYFDPNFSLDKITFTAREFSKMIRGAKEYSAVVYDEAYIGLSSRSAMSLINRTLVKMLAEIRQKKLFVGIVMPTFFDLDRYAAIWRSRALVHVYTTKDFKRGRFMFFNNERKKSLYLLGKKFYSYHKPPANFLGRFTNFYPVDEAAYRKRKKDSLVKRGTDEEQAVVMDMARKETFKKLIEMDGVTNEKKAEILGVSQRTYYNWVGHYNETGEI